MAHTGYRFTLLLIALLAVLSLATGGVAGPSDFEAIHVSFAGTTVANGISNRGDIVGLLSDASGTHGFSLPGGQFTTLDLIPGASDTEAYGLNDKGDIVGKFLDGSGEHGLLLSNRKVTTIDIPSATFTDVRYQQQGQIVGHFRDERRGRRIPH